MNKNRRKRLEKIVESLSSIMDELELIGEEEQDVYNNMPENLQYSIKGEMIEENANDIIEAKDDLSDIIDILQNVIEK